LRKFQEENFSKKRKFRWLGPKIKWEPNGGNVLATMATNVGALEGRFAMLREPLGLKNPWPTCCIKKCQGKSPRR